MFVRVSLPSYIFQKIYGGTGTNTNSLMFIPPFSCFGQKTVDIVPDASKIGATAYAATQVVVLAGAGSQNIPTVTENGNILASSSSRGIVTRNSNWLSYRYNLTQAISNFKIYSAGTILAEIFGANGNVGFGGYYSGFGDAPSYNITVSGTTLGYICSGIGTLSVASGLGTYQWYKNGSPIVGATNNSYTLSTTQDLDPASYYVVVTLAGGCTVTSNQVESDICPCTKPGVGGTPDSYTKLAISFRDQKSTANWPLDI